MAPLYQRYVPPKRSKAAVVASESADLPKTATTVTPNQAASKSEKKKGRIAVPNLGGATSSTRHAATTNHEAQGALVLDSRQQKKRKRDLPPPEVSSSNGPALHPDRVALVARESHDGRRTESSSNARAEGSRSKGRQTVEAAIKRRKVDDSKQLSSDAPDDLDEEARKILKKHGGVLSKFQRSMQRTATAEPQPEKGEVEKRELRDLVPIPQPAREVTPEYKQTFSTLPDWVANPDVVFASAKVAFDKLDIDHDTIQILHKLGYDEAFAVQAALLPRLLSRIKDDYAPVNDICVGAPTGSGKTLAYSLPIAVSLKGVSRTPKMQALIVVPTRELVQQVSATLSSLTDKRIGVSVGHQNFADEQDNLVQLTPHRDVEGYERLMTHIGKRQRFEFDSDENHDFMDDFDLSDEQLDKYYADCLKMAPYSIPGYASKVDVLVCTPGRLVEHLKSTVGFNLDDLEWLVIDEADQLLDQSFQDWVAEINRALKRQDRLKSPDSTLDNISIRTARYVRKVILSATMTRDINHLNALQLRRPSMVIVQNDRVIRDQVPDTDMIDERAGDFEVPALLEESVVPVGDGSEKPLYLVAVLESIFGGAHLGKSTAAGKHQNHSTTSRRSTSSSSSSDDDSGSESDSDMSSTSSDSSSSSNSSSLIGNASESQRADISSASGPELRTSSPGMSQVLIFASSTTEAHRLSHLLTSLIPAIPCTLLTRDHKTSRDLTSAPTQGRIIVSTDLASRGLDLPLTHVINYTVPRSLESYVHRVGRTARAGRAGVALSLVTDKEAAWFWNEIARNNKVERGKVERQRVVIEQGWKAGSGKLRYETVLAEMSAMVDDEGRGRQKGKKVKKKGQGQR